MTDTEKKQKERLQETINTDIPEMDVSISYETKRNEIEIPDTWVDFLMYPAGILAAVLLRLVVDYFLR